MQKVTSTKKVIAPDSKVGVAYFIYRSSLNCKTIFYFNYKWTTLHQSNLKFSKTDSHLKSKKTIIKTQVETLTLELHVSQRFIEIL